MVLSSKRFSPSQFQAPVDPSVQVRWISESVDPGDGCLSSHGFSLSGLTDAGKKTWAVEEFPVLLCHCLILGTYFTMCSEKKNRGESNQDGSSSPYRHKFQSLLRRVYPTTSNT